MIDQIAQWQEEIANIRRELKSLPKGYLVKRRNYYYWRSRTQERGITKDKIMIQSLARRAYLLARLEQLETNLTAARSTLKKYELASAQELINNLPNPYQGLPPNYFLRRPADDWANQPYEKKQTHADGLTILTNSGLWVRSKSELIIANALDSKEIPYRYEEKLLLGKQVRYPDFTIKRPSDGRIVLWEHLGGDDIDYVDGMKSKIALYAGYGYIPFHNLICTFEEDVKDSKYIYGLIDLTLLR